jgi:hypothetical protein
MTEVKTTRATGIPSLVWEEIVQQVRCVRLATGLVVYEFTIPGGKKVVQVSAEAYDQALDHARENTVEEPRHA